MQKTPLLDSFWRQLSTSKQATLLLDYDGTLAPFKVARDQARPYPGVREILAAIGCETASRLVIISGRAIDDLLPLLAMAQPPEIWGCHGWERLYADGRRPAVELPEAAATGLREAGRWVKAEHLDRYCEPKPASLAIHWRGQPAALIEELGARVTAGWQPIVARSGLELHPFNGGLELRCPGRDKGTAIMTVLAELEADEPVAFLGDDLTDEDGFRAIRARGLGVLVGHEQRQTQARLQIEPPDDLLDFLGAWYEHAPRKSDLTARRPT